MSGADIGLIGLGTMGAMLALNIADNGFTVAVHNRTAARIPEFLDESGPLSDKLTGHAELSDFVAAIAKPRSIILMVPAGEAVDAQIASLRPLLDDDDLIIDAGNANFHDTNRRAREATGPFWVSASPAAKKARDMGRQSWAAANRSIGTVSRRCWKRSAPNMKARPVRPGWALRGLGILSKRFTTVLNTLTCR